MALPDLPQEFLDRLNPLVDEWYEANKAANGQGEYKGPDGSRRSRYYGYSGRPTGDISQEADALFKEYGINPHARDGDHRYNFGPWSHTDVSDYTKMGPIGSVLERPDKASDWDDFTGALGTLGALVAPVAPVLGAAAVGVSNADDGLFEAIKSATEVYNPEGGGSLDVLGAIDKHKGVFSGDKPGTGGVVKGPTETDEEVLIETLPEEPEVVSEGELAGNVDDIFVDWPFVVDVITNRKGDTGGGEGGSVATEEPRVEIEETPTWEDVSNAPVVPMDAEKPKMDWRFLTGMLGAASGLNEGSSGSVTGSLTTPKMDQEKQQDITLLNMPDKEIIEWVDLIY